jgi:tripartite-type tricarboxylate transporter receptor subunit TctC
MAEAGYPDVEGSTWTAVVVPFGTPKDIIAQLYKMLAAIHAQPDVKERLAAMAFEPIASTPEECNEFFRIESTKWSKVIKLAGIRAD